MCLKKHIADLIGSEEGGWEWNGGKGMPYCSLVFLHMGNILNKFMSYLGSASRGGAKKLECSL